VFKTAEQPVIPVIRVVAEGLACPATETGTRPPHRHGGRQTRDAADMTAKTNTEPYQARAVTGTRVVIALLLTAPFVAMLWVGSYARLGPTFIGIPFFYWYQILWVFLSTGMIALAHHLLRRERRQRGVLAGGKIADD
jgi:hypothetical protein